MSLHRSFITSGAILAALTMLVPTVSQPFTGTIQAAQGKPGNDIPAGGWETGETSPASLSSGNPSPGKSTDARLAGIIDELIGRPGLASAIERRDSGDLVEALHAETGNERPADLGAIFDILTGGTPPAPPASASLEGALRSWASVAQRKDVETELALTRQLETTLPSDALSPLIRILDAMTEAERLRLKAFEDLSPAEIEWLSTLSRDAIETDPRAIALADRVDRSALLQGASILWHVTNEELPNLRSLVPTEEILQEGAGGVRGSDAALSALERTLFAATSLPPDCVTQAAGLEGSPAGSLRASLQSLGSHLGTSGPELRSALDAADTLPPDLQRAVGRIVRAYAQSLEGLPLGCGEERRWELASASLVRAIRTSAPTLAKWGLVFEHAPPLATATDPTKVADAQLVMARTQDGSMARAVAFSAWESNVVLGPTPRRELGPLPLANAVLGVYESLGLDATPEERAQLLQDADLVPLRTQEHAARILLAEADAIRLLNDPPPELLARTTRAYDLAPIAARLIGSPDTTWDDVAWLREYYANVDAAHELTRLRYQAAYDVATAIDAAALAHATEIGVQGDRFTIRETSGISDWLARLLPWRTARAQAIPDVPSVPTLPGTASNFMDPLELVVVGGSGPTRYDADLNPKNPGRQVLTLDLGGNDVYLNACGGAASRGPASASRLPIPVSVCVDLGGDDTFDAQVDSVAQGAAVAAGDNAPGAIGLLYKQGGRSTFRAPGLSQGSSMNDAPGGFALGVLVVTGGNNVFEAKPSRIERTAIAQDVFVVEQPMLEGEGVSSTVSTGEQAVIMTTLSDLAGWQGYSATWSGLDPDPASKLSTAAGVLLAGRGNDQFASPRGQGAAIVYDARLFPGLKNGATQTPTIGGVGLTAHGIGALVNLDGNDQYAGCSRICQAAGRGGLGLLVDLNGTDAYSNLDREPSFEQGVSSRGNDRVWHDGRAGLGIDASREQGEGVPPWLQNALGVSDPRQDSDGDGAPDAAERALGTDPEDRRSAPVGPIDAPLPITGVLPQGSDKILDIGMSPTLASAMAGFDTTAGLAPGNPLPRLLALSGGGTTRYEASYAITIDLGGNDHYSSNAGANLPFHARDLTDDLRVPFLDTLTRTVPDQVSDQLPAGAAGGIIVSALPGLLLEVGGDDKYEAKSSTRPTQGAASHLGLGLLLDLAGNDKYESKSLSQGAASAPDQIFTGDVTAADPGRLPPRGAIGILLDVGGKNGFTSRSRSQGYAEGQGALGILMLAGNGLAMPSTFVGPGQGWTRELSSEAAGIFANLAGGDDTYQSPAEELTQGAHHARRPRIENLYHPGSGVFIDAGGDDVYRNRTSDLSVERNDVARFPPYEPDRLPFYQLTVLDAFLDVENDAASKDGSRWPALVKAAFGLDARDKEEAPLDEGCLDSPACLGTPGNQGLLIHLPTLGIAIGNTGPNTYERDYDLLVDLGGSNAFRNNAGGAYARTSLAILTNATPAPTSVTNTFMIPLREAPDQSGSISAGLPAAPSQGAAFLGIGMLVVTSTNSTLDFNATTLAQGAARLGVGVLYLNNTRDVTLRAERLAQGAADLQGVGILWNAGNTSTRHVAQEWAQAAAGDGSIAVLYHAGGDDEYDLAKGSGQAYALSGGIALAILAKEGYGNDTYTSGPNAQAHANGANAIAILKDGGGDRNSFHARRNETGDANAQAAAYDGTTILLVLEGNNEYFTDGSQAQAYSAGATGISILNDQQGRTHYTASRLSQAASDLTPLAVKIGDLSPTRLSPAGFALLLDERGDDMYVNKGQSNGYGQNAILLDLGGYDRYQNADLAAPPPAKKAGSPRGYDPTNATQNPTNPTAWSKLVLEHFDRLGGSNILFNDQDDMNRIVTEYRDDILAYLSSQGISADAASEAANSRPALTIPWSCQGPTTNTPVASGAPRVLGLDGGRLPAPDSDQRNNAFWTQTWGQSGGGVGLDLGFTDLIECAARNTLGPTSPTGVYTLAKCAPKGCLVARPAGGIPDATPTLQSADLFWESDRESEGFSHGPVFVTKGTISPTDNSAVFIYDAATIDDGRGTWTASILARAPRGDLSSAGAPSTPRSEIIRANAHLDDIIDEPPRIEVGGPVIFNPHLGPMRIPIQVSRDVARGCTSSTIPPCAAGIQRVPLDPYLGAEQHARSEDDPMSLIEPAEGGWEGARPALRAPKPAGNGAVRIEWEATPGADLYRVYRAANTSNADQPPSEFNFTGWTSARWTTFVDGPLEHGKSYSYIVTALRLDARSGKETWTESAWRTDWIKKLPAAESAWEKGREPAKILFDANAPGTVISPQADAGDNWTRLTWRHVPFADDYVINRTAPPERNEGIITIPDPLIECSGDMCTLLDWPDTNYTNNHTFTYTIAASRQGNDGRPSDPAVVTANPGALVTASIDGGPLLASERYVPGRSWYELVWDDPRASSGAYNVEVTAKDSGGRITTKRVGIVVDAAAPPVQLDLGPWINATARVPENDGFGTWIEWAPSTSEKPASVSLATLNADGSRTPWLYHQPPEGRAFWTELTNGQSYTFLVNTRSVTGNVQGWQIAASTRVDLEAPVIERVEAPAFAKPGDVVKVRAYAHDGISGLGSATAALDEGPPTPLTLVGDHYEGHLRVPDLSGRIALKVRVVDVAGNLREHDQMQIVVDETSPRIAYTRVDHAFAGAAGAGTPGGSATLVVAVTDEQGIRDLIANTTNVSLAGERPLKKDPVTGEYRLLVQFDRPDLASGTYHVPVRVRDDAGNDVHALVRIEIDDAPLAISNATVTGTGPNWISLAWRTDRPATTEALWGLSPATLRATEDVNLSGFGLEHTTTITGLTPSQTYALKPRGHTRSGIEALGPILQATTRAGIPLTFESPRGVPYWSGEQTIRWTLDAADAGEIDQTVRLVEIKGEKTYPMGNVTRGQTNLTLDTTRVPDGEYVVEIQATRGVITSVSISDTVIVDNTPPRIALLSPTYEAKGPGVILEGLVLDRHAEGLDLSVEIAGIEANASVHDGAFRALVPEVPDGVQEATVRARDAAGNVATLRAALLVDATPPTITHARIEYADDRSACAPPCAFTLRLGTHDATRVASVVLTSHSADATRAATLDQRTGEWIVRATSDPSDNPRVRVRLVDALGNAATLEAAKLHVDESPPRVVQLSTAPVPGRAVTEARIHYVASEPVTAEAILRDDKGGMLHVGSSAPMAPWGTLLATGLKPGTNYAVDLKIVDGAGNVGRANGTLRTFDDMLSPSAPTDLRVTDGHDGTARLSWEPAVDNAGIAAYDVYRRLGDELVWRKILHTQATHAVDDAHDADQSREYAVIAIDLAGNEGPRSGSVTVTLRVLARIMEGTVTPTTGTQTEPFTYRAIVETPASIPLVVKVVVNGIPHEMRKVDDACEASCPYQAEIELPPTRAGQGEHTYYFLAQTESSLTRAPPGDDVKEGPVVVAAGNDPRSIPSATLFAIVALGCACALLTRRRS